MSVSRRALLEKEREAQREELKEDLYVGMIVTGTVTRIVDFGVFVELGGAEGLIPLKEIAWGRDVKPEDVVKVGDKVDVQIKAGLGAQPHFAQLARRKGDPGRRDGAFPQGATFIGTIKIERSVSRSLFLVSGIDPNQQTGRWAPFDVRARS